MWIKGLQHRCFPVILRNFSEHLFYGTPPMAASVILHFCFNQCIWRVDTIKGINVWSLQLITQLWSNNKYLIASIQITNTEIFTFIAVLVFKLLNHQVFVYKQQQQQQQQIEAVKNKLIFKKEWKKNWMTVLNLKI